MIFGLYGDGGIAMGVLRWGYCGKEEKEGPDAASKNEDRGQKVRRRRADRDSMD